MSRYILDIAREPCYSSELVIGSSLPDWVTDRIVNVKPLIEGLIQELIASEGFYRLCGESEISMMDIFWEYQNRWNIAMLKKV